jgi:CBS domain-containing protein
MNAAQLMTPNAMTVNEDQACDVAAGIMWDHDVGSVPIIDDERRVVGIVTDRDLCMAAYTKNERLADIPLRAVMSKNVVCANERDDLRTVEELMQANQIRRLPVVDEDNRISGIIALADIALARGVTAAGDEVSEQEIATTIEAVSRP